MLLPKIQRKRRFPARCSHPPWRNIDTNSDASHDF
jgi:hypothetical protein